MNIHGQKIGFDVLLESLFFLLIPIAILPKYIQLGVYFFVCVLLIAMKCRAKIDAFSVLLVCYMGIYAFSIIRRLFVDDTISTERILSTLNLYVIWVIAIILYSYYLNSNVPLDRIGKAALFNMLIMIALGILAIILSKLYGYPNEIQLFNRKLYYWEWTNMRFVGLFDYPTQVTIFTVLMYPWASMYVRKKYSQNGKIVHIIFSLLGFVPVFLCRSRTGYLLYWIPVLIYPLMGIVARIKRSQIRGFACFCGIIAAIFIVFNLDLCIVVVEKLLLMREGSQVSRTMIYSGTWEKIRENPILGFGIKVPSEWKEYVLGSHSSYLGFLYKAGILGVLILLIALVFKVRNLYIVATKSKSVYAAWIIIAVMSAFIFFVLEDMDGVDWLLCTWLSILGLVDNKNFVEYEWEEGY